jgi:hypothetical protein
MRLSEAKKCYKVHESRTFPVNSVQGETLVSGVSSLPEGFQISLLYYANAVLTRKRLRMGSPGLFTVLLATGTIYIELFLKVIEES